MNGNTKKRVLTLLNQLDEESLVEVAAKVDNMLTYRKQQRFSADSTRVDMERMYDAFTTQLKAILGVQARPFAAYRTNDPKTLQQAYDNVQRFINVAFTKASITDPRVRDDIYLVLGRLLTQHIGSYRDAPVNERALLRATKNVSSLFYREFPGYITSGLGDTVIKALAERARSRYSRRNV